MCKRKQIFPVLNALPVSKPDILVSAAADVLPAESVAKNAQCQVRHRMKCKNRLASWSEHRYYGTSLRNNSSMAEGNA